MRIMGDFVIVEPIKEPEGLILLPKPEQPRRGIVRAIGNQVRELTTDHIGTVVYFPRYAGYEVQDDEGNTYLVLREREILLLDKETA